MGEIIFALFVGLWSFGVGFYMYYRLDQEEKKYLVRTDTKE